MAVATVSAFTWHSRKPNYWVSLTMIGSLRCIYTPYIVWLKSDRMGILIVGLIHLDDSIDNRITPACIRSIGSDFCILHRLKIFFPGPWARSRRTMAAASFLQNNRKQERHCASSLCNYHVHIYEMYKDVASSRSSYAIFLEAEFAVAGDVKRSASLH